MATDRFALYGPSLPKSAQVRQAVAYQVYKKNASIRAFREIRVKKSI